MCARLQMNYGSPLSKDHRAKKDEYDPLPKKEKPKLSLGTAKKLLKTSNHPIGINEMIWLNSYMLNKVQGECLPKTFLSNDLPTEIYRVYGKDGAEAFQKKIIADFCNQNGLSSVKNE